MQAFEYARPASTSAAVKLLSAAWGETELLAGGSDLLARMKDNISAPRRIVSLTRVRELKGIEYRPGAGLRIGAMATFEEVAANPSVREHYPGIAQAVERIGGPQTRHVATVGGNLCQRPRCWYYRNGFGLLATDHGKPVVTNGDNRYHAIFGNSGPAYFVSPSNLGPMLVALDARLKLVGPKGSRELAVERFFLIPKREDEREHAIQPNEIIAEITVPPANGARTAFCEVAHRSSLDWPLAVAGVVLHMRGRTVQSARVVMGQVAPIPWRSHEAEAALAGKSVSEATAGAAGKAAVAKATPLSKNRYKVQLASIAVKRAILRAAGEKV